MKLQVEFKKLNIPELILAEKSQSSQSEPPLKKNEPRLKMVSASYYIPKENKLRPLGDDAHFICADEQTIGVADGVGGWAKHGIDAGEYARNLMTNAANAVRKIKSSSSPSSVVDPKRVLREAFAGATEVKGASTACIVSLNGGVLHAANVGDSGFMVFRDGQFQYSSPIQQHYFNCPYQLGNDGICNRPDCALEPKVPVMAGDIVVLGTDGLLDNFFIGEIEMIIEKMKEVEAEDLAEKIARTAYIKSLKKDCETPFSRLYKSLGGQEQVGGKKDDITVIVSHIVCE